jgi:lysophospholipase L1-like esterase
MKTILSDNVHPTSAGYAKMALEVVNQINCWQNGY